MDTKTEKTKNAKKPWDNVYAVYSVLLSLVAVALLVSYTTKVAMIALIALGSMFVLFATLLPTASMIEKMQSGNLVKVEKNW